MPSCQVLELPKIVVFAAMFCSLFSAAGTAATPHVSSVHVDLEDWILVPMVEGAQVDSIVGVLPMEHVVASNVAIMWFQRLGDGTWKSLAWETQDYSAAIQHVVDYYDIPLDPADWPVAVTPSTGTTPSQFGDGVFPDDPLADAVAGSDDPDATVNALTISGWQSSMLPVWLKASCAKEEHLETISALVEADIASGSNGALASLLGSPGYQCGEWVSGILLLDSSGTAIVPSFAEIQPYSNVPSGATFWQSTTPGTLLIGPQSIIVSLGYNSGGVTTTTHNKVLSVLDVHAPEVVITPNATGVFRNVPSRLPFLVAPETISFSAAGTDAVDGTVDVILTLNGDPYIPGTVISQPGLYAVQATATDSHGNLAEETTVFEIRDRETFETAVIVEDLQDYYSPSGELEDLHVTLLIASHGFDVSHLHLATLQASLLDESGNFVTFNAKPNGIAFSHQQDGTFVYDPLVVDIQIERGYMRVPFSIDLTGLGLTALPPEVMVSGSSSEARATNSFEFAEVVSTIASIDAVQALDALGMLQPVGAAPTIPAVDPPLQCRWRFELQLQNAGSCSHRDPEAEWCGIGGLFRTPQDAFSDITDRGGKPKASGYAIDGCFDLATSACTLGASVFLYTWLETNSTGNACSILLVSSPEFRCKIAHRNNAQGTLGAGISVTSGGFAATVTGSVTGGSVSTPPAYQYFGVDVPMQHIRRRPVDRVFKSDGISVQFSACALGVLVSSSSNIDVIADGTYRVATVLAELIESSPDVNISANVTSGPCVGRSRIIKY